MSTGAMCFASEGVLWADAGGHASSEKKSTAAANTQRCIATGQLDVAARVPYIARPPCRGFATARAGCCRGLAAGAAPAVAASPQAGVWGGPGVRLGLIWALDAICEDLRSTLVSTRPPQVTRPPHVTLTSHVTLPSSRVMHARRGRSGHPWQRVQRHRTAFSRPGC
eukprot:scaffold2809_cov373-Prasinococcus_capsulatus_cf.AAC.14